jgi:hypothetical protein
MSTQPNFFQLQVRVRGHTRAVRLLLVSLLFNAVYPIIFFYNWRIVHASLIPRSNNSLSPEAFHTPTCRPLPPRSFYTKFLAASIPALYHPSPCSACSRKIFSLVCQQPKQRCPISASCPLIGGRNGNARCVLMLPTRVYINRQGGGNLCETQVRSTACRQDCGHGEHRDSTFQERHL